MFNVYGLAQGSLMMLQVLDSMLDCTPYHGGTAHTACYGHTIQNVPLVLSPSQSFVTYACVILR